MAFMIMLIIPGILFIIWHICMAHLIVTSVAEDEGIKKYHFMYLIGIVLGSLWVGILIADIILSIS